MWNLKGSDTNEHTYKTERGSQTQKMNLQLPEGRESQGLWEAHTRTSILKQITNKDLVYFSSQGTLLNGMWQPGWSGSLGGNEYMYMYG